MPTAPGNDTLRSHWAMHAIGREDLRRAHRVLDQRLAVRAVGEQISFDFDDSAADDPAADDQIMERVLLAYELAALEGLDEFTHSEGRSTGIRDQAVLAASSAFEIRRLAEVPTGELERVFHVLQLSTLAYCGDRWSDLRRWYNENSSLFDTSNATHDTVDATHDTSNATHDTADAGDDVRRAVSHVHGGSAAWDQLSAWDQRLLRRLFDCWVRLFRKDGWDDLAGIAEIIAGLRAEQERMESREFANGSQARNRALALRLTALYHWAKATEVVAGYMLDGSPAEPFGQIDKHFEAGTKAAQAVLDVQLEIVLRWLHAASRVMVSGSLWWATRTINSKTSEFVRSLTGRGRRAMFELLPPQRAALLEQGLLDQAKTAIVVDLPTSGGKTLLAQFRILQALTQFDAQGGWVAYAAPTRALSAQLTRRLRRDFEPIGVRVEQLTAAVEVDAFEEDLLADESQPFHVLVATPEKLSLLIRNKQVQRPLALMVMDEAHNLADASRGMRIELLLATVKRDCPVAAFLLMLPDAGDPDSIARWLASGPGAGGTISLATTPWMPNERIIGIHSAARDESRRAGWRLEFETLTTTPKAMQLRGRHRVGGVRPVDVPASTVIGAGRDGDTEQKGLGLQTAAISSVLSARGTSIAVGTTIRTVWKMAEKAAQALPPLNPVSDDIKLVQDFLRSEIGPDFELIRRLEHGVGVHHTGLPDDVRALMEWLAETGELRVLCATTTIAQGVNFPVSSVFLMSRYHPEMNRSVEMSPREFWNLAGRAGRIGHDSVGVIGLAEGADRDAAVEFVSRNTGALVSRLVALLDELADAGDLTGLSGLLWQDQWSDFRCYIAHLWAEKKNLDAVLADSEQLLRQTYGYTTLRSNPTTHEKADALLEAAQHYARKLADMPPGTASLADATGFSPEGVLQAFAGLRGLEDKLTPDDWMPESLFGTAGKMAGLYGVMLDIPQIKEQLQQIGGTGADRSRISEITLDWVNGKSIKDIAEQYFSEDGDSSDDGGTAALTDACRAIYKAIVNNGTWGVAALRQMSGIDLDSLSQEQRRRINALPAMIYHGVRSEEAVLMRMNAVPRTAAEMLGSIYRDMTGDAADRFSLNKAREFLRGLHTAEWEHARPRNASLSGSGYRRIWQILSGEQNR